MTIKKFISVSCALAAAGIGLSILAHSTFLDSHNVYGSSMEKTIFDGDTIFAVDKSICSIDRGDIITFFYENELIVKRLVKTPGENYGVCSTHRNFLVDPRLKEDSSCKLETRVLGPEEYFFVGDNNLHSIDSRKFGPISRKDVIGQVVYIQHNSQN